MKRPFPLILSAPSGAGKTSIAKRILAERPDVGYSVSCTTRAPRPGEVDGRDYFFQSPADFLAARERGEFAESAEVHGRLYGTLRSEVERVLGEGKHVMMDIDVQGARQFARAFPESVLVFVLPPDAATLASRLDGRQTESRDVLRLRLRGALDELRAVDEYEYVIVNEELDRAVGLVGAVIDAETARRRRMHDIDGLVGAIAAGLERQISTP